MRKRPLDLYESQGRYSAPRYDSILDGFPFLFDIYTYI